MKIIQIDGKQWAAKLYNSLLTCRTSHKTLINMSPYKLIYGKAGDLLMGHEHQPLWDVKTHNLSLHHVGRQRLLQFH